MKNKKNKNKEEEEEEVKKIEKEQKMIACSLQNMTVFSKICFVRPYFLNSKFKHHKSKIN
jgi:hypothetical protein